MGACVSQSKTKASSPSNMALKASKEITLDKRAREVYAMIKEIPFVAGLPDSAVRQVSQKARAVSFSAGQVIMREGDEGRVFYLIAEGECQVYQNGSLLSTLRKGDYIGEQALLSSAQKRTATVKCAQPTRCFTLDAATFAQVARSVPHMAFVERMAAQSVVDGTRVERKNVFTEPTDEATDTDDADAADMDEDTLAWLIECVSANVLFRSRQRDTIAAIVKGMTVRNYAANETICKQGDVGHEFFVVDAGQCTVVKDGELKAELRRGQAFGELALAYNCARTATIRAAKGGVCTVYVLQRSRYQSSIRAAQQSIDRSRLDALRQIPLLASLAPRDLSEFAGTLQRKTYAKGHVYFTQGDVGDSFYLITDGCVEGVANRADGSEKSFTLESGEYFGELALRTSAPRSATLVAATECVCFVAEKRQFEVLFGGFDNAMERQTEEYDRKVQSSKEYKDFLMKRSLMDMESGPVIGRGKYGLVQFVRDPQSGTVYALKAVRKAWVNSRHAKQSKRRINSLFNERNVMRRLNSSDGGWLVKLRGTFKDDESVYYLMSACVGGDLFNVLKSRGYVSEKHARFYVACMVAGLEQIHSCDVIHRDLKPENIVLDAAGYGTLTDFGFAKELPREAPRTYTLCGTPGYIAPEIILGQGYSYAADWFALGCVMFDMLTGAPPFPTRTDQFEMIHALMAGKLQLPQYLSFWAKDLLRNLIQLKPMRRFGVINGGVDRIKRHGWFNGFDWDAFYARTMPAPFKPAMNGAMDPSNFDRTDITTMTQELDGTFDPTPLPKDMQNWDINF